LKDSGPAAAIVPAIVRIAGLPAEAIAPLGSAACMDSVRSIVALEGELASIRCRIVERLQQEIKGAPAAVRRALLAIKRDCFNGRDLAARRSSPEWPIFVAAAPDLASCVGELEEFLAARRAAFEEIFVAERQREIHHLLSLLDDENLRQGMALASPEVLSHVERLLRPFASYGRKERRLAESLLRYVSRIALKLSPFSTFTRLGLAAIDGESPAQSIRLSLQDATQRELRRLKKHVVIKYFTMLRHHGPFRDRLPIWLNPSVERVGADRYRFIEPFHWRLHREAREFHYCNENQVAANLRGPLIEELLELLRGRRSYGELVELLARRLDSQPAAVESVVRKLSEMGFLVVEFPWPTNAFDPERGLLEFLGGLPEDGALAGFAELFARLLDLRDAPIASGARLGAYRTIDRLRLEGFHRLSEALELPEVKEDVNDRQLHEDVFLLPAADPEWRTVARISRSSAELALDSVRPMVLYSDLNYTRYELLHSLQALAARQWPGKREVAFLDLFHVAQPLWAEYVKAATATITEWKPELWNPYGLREILELKQLRDEVLREMEASLRREGEELVLDRAGAERAVRDVPDVYTPAFGPCLFAQPARPEGDLWVLNHMLDGTGRFSNRYTTVMPCGLRERFSSILGEGCAVVSLFGRPAETVEILCARDDHLNVHQVQTERVLELPGENPDLPAERRIGIRDLRVLLDEPMPVLADRDGRRLMPIFLGTNGLVGMPTLVRFLSRFGIGEFRLMHPPRRPERGEGITSFRRLRIGNLVLRRRMWVFAPAATFPDYARLSDAELFVAVNRWRLDRGLPDAVFAAERQEAKFNLWPLHKPQYIDFTSPSFMPLLRAAMESANDELKLEEVLPAPEAFPVTKGGQRWAVEAQLDSVAFQPLHPWPAWRTESEIPRGQLQIV
jgi:hypothetical protein